MVAQSAADVQTVAAGNHDVQQKERGRLALGVGNKVSRGMEDAGRKTRRLQMMLNETGDVRVVLKHKNYLAQQLYPRLSIRPAALRVLRRLCGRTESFLE